MMKANSKRLLKYLNGKVSPYYFYWFREKLLYLARFLYCALPVIFILKFSIFSEKCAIALLQVLLNTITFVFMFSHFYQGGILRAFLPPVKYTLTYFRPCRLAKFVQWIHAFHFAISYFFWPSIFSVHGRCLLNCTSSTP